MITREISFICAICGQSVEVITCVTDESGRAVHQKCYAAKLAREVGARKGPVAARRTSSKQLRSLKPRQQSNPGL